MFRRPSSRRKAPSREITLNLVPILDTLVALIAFLLFSSAFLAIAFIDTPAPMIAPASEQIEKMKEKPLQLTAYIQENQIILSDWTGSREAHTIANTKDPATGDSQYDLEKLHQTLVEVKHRHPKEKQIILKPNGGVAYEAIIGIIDASRLFDKTDTPLYTKDEHGVEVADTALFPEVIFGNILSK